MMSLATAIKQVIEVRGLTSGEVTRRLGKGRDYTTFFRLLNGRTTDPRVITLVRLCVALETSPSELLELAGVWSPDTPGQATPDDLRLRVAFGQVRALPVAMQQRAVPLVEAPATRMPRAVVRRRASGAGHPCRRRGPPPPRRTQRRGRPA